MRTRDHNWYDPKKNKTLYSFQVHHHGKWRHVAENGKPLIYTTPGERNAKRREYRSKKSTDSNVAPLRDAYDVLNEQLQVLRQQMPADPDAGLYAATPDQLRALADRREADQRIAARQQVLADMRVRVAAGATDEELAAWLSTGDPYVLFGNEGDRMGWSTRETVERALAAPVASPECPSCGPAGVYAADGAGPFDCYDCGKKAGLADDELPGMWSGADLTGGKTDALPSPLSHPLAPTGGVYSAAPMMIDLDRVFLDAVKQAVAEQTWMPAEYVANDWQADVLDFLRNGPSAFAAPLPPVDDAMVERAARGMWASAPRGACWEVVHPASQDDWRKLGRAALTAALGREGGK